VDGVLERLLRLYPRAIDLDMGRLRVLLAKLGHPERRLAPVLHVAGTNGKGSTCAFARAIADAAGLRAQVYTSPHLVDFNERIRLTGGLVSHARLAEMLETVERANAGAPRWGSAAEATRPMSSNGRPSARSPRSPSTTGSSSATA
jgi:dihydrofolate synthase/folylpolyglutamate synthase